MKILVTAKRVSDYEAKLKIRPDNKDIEKQGLNMIMNPFDEIAVEEALRLREIHGGEVVVLSIGPKNEEAHIRAALAMGADRGISVTATDNIENQLDSIFTAKLIKAVCEKESPDIVIMGKQSIDAENHQTAEMLAELWGVPQATQANKIKIEGQKAMVTREADGGLETIEVELPCVITADLRLCEPRYPSLPGIMKAKKKPLEFLDFSPTHNARVKLLGLSYPQGRKAGVKVQDIAELVKKLKEEAKVI